MHPLSAQVVQLGLGLDALRDHFQLQALGHFDDVAGHWARRSIRADAIHERFVDLENIQRQLLQVLEAGETGAEIIDGGQMAQRPCAVNGCTGSIDLHKATLCSLQPDLVREHSAAAQGHLQFGQEAATANVFGRQVDRHVQAALLHQQWAEVMQYAVDQLVGDRQDQAALLSQWNEQVRTHQTAIAAAPAQ
ncbi:hypothetical protein D3C79_792740 [compost metagenome]